MKGVSGRTSGMYLTYKLCLTSIYLKGVEMNRKRRDANVANDVN